MNSSYSENEFSFLNSNSNRSKNIWNLSIHDMNTKYMIQESIGKRNQLNRWYGLQNMIKITCEFKLKSSEINNMVSIERGSHKDHFAESFTSDRVTLKGTRLWSFRGTFTEVHDTWLFLVHRKWLVAEITWDVGFKSQWTLWIKRYRFNEIDR